MILTDDDYQFSPGLVGKITRYIISTAPKPQPALAFSAALTAVATLKAHKVQSKSELRTNIYALALAGSGAGKDHPSRAIKKIFKATGNDLLLTGEPASDSGLLKSLAVNSGRALLIWDEFGHALAALTNSRAGAHHKKIVETMLKLFSTAGSTYLGKEYSNFDGRQSRKDIDQPNLSVYASTVPHRFFESLNSDYVVDGFLPRWLVFEAENQDVDYREISPDQKEIPLDIIEAIAELNYRPMSQARGNMALLSVEPAVIEATPDAGFSDVAQYFEEQKRAYRDAGNHSMEAVLARGYEHFVKVALTLSDGNMIGKAEADFALQVVETSNQRLGRLIGEHVADNEIERTSKRVENLVRSCGVRGITKSSLTIKTRWISKYNRDSIITDLLSAKKIFVYDHVDAERQRRKAITCYYHVDHYPDK